METQGPKILYVIGTGHSGSTLLDVMLGAHSKVFGAGEMASVSFDGIGKEICSCDKKALECSFWGRVLKEDYDIPGLGIERNVLDSFLGISKFRFREGKSSVSVRKYLDINRDLYRKIFEVSGSEVVVDSSKEIDRAELLSRNNEFEILLVHLIRDGRGVMWSYKRKYGKRLLGVFLWVFTNLKAEIVKRRNSNVKSIRVRYEDLVEDPERELGRILDLVGLSFEFSMLGPQNERHQIRGNRMRFSGVSEIKKDVSWKKNLSFLDRFIFQLLAGILNKIYGY